MKGRRMKPSSVGSTSVSRLVNRVTVEAGDSMANYDAPLTRIPTIDDVLNGHVSTVNDDFVAYRNHVYRVCESISSERIRFHRCRWSDCDGDTLGRRRAARPSFL